MSEIDAKKAARAAKMPTETDALNQMQATVRREGGVTKDVETLRQASYRLREADEAADKPQASAVREDD
jgi:hypothetical protein